jgi:hypothetical protein
MNFSRIRRFTFAALAALSVAGLMQAAEQGTFHLSSQTRWGQAILPPGDYKVYVPDAGVTDRIMRVEGANKSVFEVPMIVSYGNVSRSSYLKLSEVNGEYVVREFSFGPQGKTFSFLVPREMHKLDMAKNNDNTLLLAVR